MSSTGLTSGAFTFEVMALAGVAFLTALDDGAGSLDTALAGLAAFFLYVPLTLATTAVVAGVTQETQAPVEVPFVGHHVIWGGASVALTFAGLGLLVFPAIIPPSVTIFEAHASISSLVFMLTFIGVLIPIMLFYNLYNYVAFRGKVPSLEQAD